MVSRRRWGAELKKLSSQDVSLNQGAFIPRILMGCVELYRGGGVGVVEWTKHGHLLLKPAHPFRAYAAVTTGSPIPWPAPAGEMTDAAVHAQEGRDETPLEALDRNTIELLNELRVASTGIQFMFGFLLVVPFDSAFKHIDTFERTVYFVALMCVAISSILLMAPSIQHRILFRRREKQFLIEVANRLAILSMCFLAAGFTAILVLLSDVVLGGAAPVIVGVLTVIGIASLWFAIPLARRKG
jgi:hypothetical protein